MDRDNSQIFHTVVITGLKDPSGNKKVALALSRIIKNMPPDKILKRLETFPWTLTRKATPKNATRLARYLDKVGARIKITPPLAASVMTDALETQILPNTHLLSQTQVLTATQVVSTPEEMAAREEPPPQPKPAIPAQQSPPPITPGRRIEPLAVPVPKQGPPPPPPRSPLDEGGLDIEPLSLGGMLDRSFQICKAHFWKLLAVVGVWWGVLAAFGVLAFIIAAVAGLTYESVARMPVSLVIIGVVVLFVGLIVLIVVSCLYQGALIHAVSSVYLGKEIRVGKAYSFAFGRLRKLFFTVLLFWLLLIGISIGAIIAGVALYFLFLQILSTVWAVLLSLPFWLALMCIPGYAFFKLLLVDKVVIIEDMAYTEAIKRSWKLISGKAEGDWPRGYFVRVVILFHVFILINLVISLIFQIPALALMFVLPQTLGSIVNHILSNVGSVVAGLFLAVCMVIFYYDIRNRKEGFDLGMLAGTREE